MKRNVFLFAWLISFSGMGQNFSIKRIEISGDKVNLYYDLLDTILTRTYTISVFSSQDNFITPLQKVKGDAGLEIRPGINKQIVWNAREELGSEFDGAVSIEVRGRVYIPFVQLDGLNRVFMRLRPTKITWTGGTQQNILNFDLYKKEEKIMSFPDIANVGHHTITIPMEVSPGKGYHFRISDSRNKDQVVLSPEFSVKRKIPLLAKIIPLGIIVGGSVLLITGNKSNKNIPDPITP